MIHKLAVVGILSSIAYIVYSSMYLGRIYLYAVGILILSGFVYYMTTSFITVKMVSKALGKDADFSLRAGMISKDGKNIQSGVFSVSDSTLLFHKRKGDFGGAEVIWSLDALSLGSYSIGKVDERHSGLLVKANGNEEVKFTSRKFLSMEGEFRKALGWPEE